MNIADRTVWLQLAKVLEPFKFLKYCVGRGIFELFIGISMIIVGRNFDSMLWCGILTAVGGFFNLILMFPCFPSNSQSAQEAGDEDGVKKVGSGGNSGKPVKKEEEMTAI